MKLYSHDEIIQLYDKLYNNENAKYSSYVINEYDMLLKNKKIKIGYHRSNILRKHILKTKCKSVLEIGSGIGLMGAYIRSKNKGIKYLGIEIDKEAYEKSRKLNLNTVNSDFKIMDKIDESFDVILLWEVIEHLQDLKRFIELAYNKLNKNGKIILSTPNYNKIYNYPDREVDNLYQDTPPIHLNFFTKQSIKNIFELNNFNHCQVKIKKLPYLQYKSLSFYKNIIKAIFNKYHGSTIFFIAQK
ncbi:class I SAM-dependent methyltransferase [Flaviramulus sp. BrNp1-15]|uniref:class I SAM-dependent methyltransferase n=1 Tax=Flaviramulus sp. BrNp1-15 TaxID=2916754 RepID=UPI001EE947D7|nr:class I SAM-dependent methyltransferase [Flaviramulus sp. BrNp1-15]ULC60582.1 class I SAM-dependent methyltransferase [Flaviramulus sp. BrNp1-15]